MLRKFMSTLRASLGLAVLLGFNFSLHAVPITNGLYAAVATTKGTFYCYLRYDLTPRTVANFVGLVTGTKDWLDYSKGTVVKQPFYPGLTFHRVIKGFMIQGGSPNGQGTDDPGYRFRNEIVSSLKHDKPGVLAMANLGNGNTNSNGSQFYVTVSPYQLGDGNYTVFGQVVEGMNIVSNINAVATDANDRPLVPVVITNLTILKIGTAASNFNAAAVTPALPVPKVKMSAIKLQGTNLILSWFQLANYDYRLCYTSDMKKWSGQYFGPYGSASVTSTNGYLFFRTVESKID
jgi:peptidyl-prolyl cis-trans isomerase A (cyclophilin A)